MNTYEDKLLVLERKHLKHQSDAIPHIRIHYDMLMLAIKYMVWQEVAGQIPRIILAVPGSLLGMAPKGNVGSTKMGVFEVAKNFPEN
jgi:hypothetical protein